MFGEIFIIPLLPRTRGIMWRGTGGREPGRIGAGGGREAGRDGAGMRESCEGGRREKNERY